MPRKTDFKKALGLKIKILRKENLLTQEELGKELKVGKSTIANYESGYSEPESEKIKKIAELFNVSLDYLLGKTLYKNYEEYDAESQKMLEGLSSLPEEQKEIMITMAFELLDKNLEESDFYVEMDKALSSVDEKFRDTFRRFILRLYDEQLHEQYQRKQEEIKHKIENLTSSIIDDPFEHPVNNFQSSDNRNELFTVPILIWQDGKLYETTENVMLPQNPDLTKQYFGYRITDDSMLPLAGIGDLAIIQKTDIYENGQTCLISLDSNLIFIRKIIDFKDYIELHTTITYNQPIKLTNAEEQNRNFKILGKVISVYNTSAFK